MSEREGLIARVRQIRRVVATHTDSSPTATPAPGPAAVPALEQRVAHLEQMLQGLQDSVYREAERHGKMIADLEARIQPAAMGEALERDARERGL